ncbi:MAG: TetR/AcrR family transcriptional regulator [Myxococcota bacterium]
MEATLQLLQAGNERPSIRAIAKRAGVGVGSVYDYFEGREGVLFAIVEHLTKKNFDELWEVLENEQQDQPVFEALSEVLDTVLEMYLTNVALTRVALRAIMSFNAGRAIVAERDRFAIRVAERVGMEIDLPFDELYRRTLAIVDMLMGVVMGELYRERDEARREALRSAMRRALYNELELARRDAAARSDLVAEKT